MSLLILLDNEYVASAGEIIYEVGAIHRSTSNAVAISRVDEMLGIVRQSRASDGAVLRSLLAAGRMRRALFNSVER